MPGILPNKDVKVGETPVVLSVTTTDACATLVFPVFVTRYVHVTNPLGASEATLRAFDARLRDAGLLLVTSTAQQTTDGNAVLTVVEGL